MAGLNTMLKLLKQAGCTEVTQTDEGYRVFAQTTWEELAEGPGDLRPDENTDHYITVGINLPDLTPVGVGWEAFVYGHSPHAQGTTALSLARYLGLRS